MMKNNGIYRVALATPVVSVGDVEANVEEHISLCKSQSGIILFPELSLTGYSNEDLFHQNSLQQDAVDGLFKITHNVDPQKIVVVGLPLWIPELGELRNCAAVVNQGFVRGIVSKSYLPNYREFKERQFGAAKSNDPKTITLKSGSRTSIVPFGTDLLFEVDDLIFGIEICEDLWGPMPPSVFQALAGAVLHLNLSASNEIVGKSDWRRTMIAAHTGRLNSAYAYCSAGPTESTRDIVFGGHNLVYENGSLLGESDRFIRQSHVLTCDIDIEKLYNERVSAPATYAETAKDHKKLFRKIRLHAINPVSDLSLRYVDPHPFVPKDKTTLDARCQEIFSTISCGLAKRFERVSKDVYIGVSGGLDSTLALLATCHTYDMLGIDRKHIHGVTLPGFGTTDRTFKNALALMENLGVSSRTIDIREQCFQMWKDMDYLPFGEYLKDVAIFAPNLSISHCWKKMTIDTLQTVLQKLPDDAKDLKFENVQARVRTNILMSLGFVVGTGDMSEIALGWCTYNADHMSMYNPNCGIPKTLVKFLVRWVAEQKLWGDAVSTCLMDIVETPISPELLPTKNGVSNQNTESSVGPYELVDFFLYHMVRNGFSPEKILYYARHVTERGLWVHDVSTIGHWLKNFYTRFFGQRWKGDCVPNGPKVGISLSPRGDWRMPPDASAAGWIRRVDQWLKENVHES